MWRKLIIELTVVLVIFVTLWFLYPALQAKMGEAFVKGAEDAHKKRLFGDAWKDV